MNRKELAEKLVALAEALVTEAPLSVEYSLEYSTIFYNTRLDTWFERDRAYVGLIDKDTDETIFELWDEDVQDAIDWVGTLGRNPDRWHRDMILHVIEMDLVPDATMARWAAKEDEE